MPFLQLVRVVVRQLLSGFYIPDRLDPDPAIIDHSVAVWFAGVVDPPGVVAFNGGVHHPLVVDREQEGVVSLAGFVRVACIRLRRRKSLAGVFDQPHAGGYAPGRESAESLDRGFADLEGTLVVRSAAPGFTFSARHPAKI